MQPTRSASDVFNAWAKEYQDKYMDVSLYGNTFDIFCERINPANAKILDIACGPGNITRYLLGKRPDLQVLGIDLAPNMVDLARVNNPGAEFLVLDCRAIEQLDTQFDGIMCGFCLPYLSKEESIDLIRVCSNLLNPNGVLYISTMEDDYEQSGLKTNSKGELCMMYLHQADYLSQALADHGFEIIHLERKVYTPANGALTTDLILIAVID